MFVLSLFVHVPCALQFCSKFTKTQLMKTICQNKKTVYFQNLIKTLVKTCLQQECSKGSSSVAFEVLIINCQIDFMNLFIFNCLTSDIILFIFNCLRSDINLFIFNCLTLSKLFLLSKNHIFVKQKRTAVYGRASLVSDFKLTWENDDLLSPRHK